MRPREISRLLTAECQLPTPVVRLLILVPGWPVTTTGPASITMPHPKALPGLAEGQLLQELASIGDLSSTEPHYWSRHRCRHGHSLLAQPQHSRRSLHLHLLKPYPQTPP